jgi:hypothetical protein
MQPPDTLSRRDFLRLGAAAIAGSCLPRLPAPQLQTGDLTRGRVLATSLIVRDAPTFQGNRLTTLRRDTLVDILETVHGGAEGDSNRVWYRLGEGQYATSSWIQTVRTDLNPVQTSVPEDGCVGEITVPYAESAWSLAPAVVWGYRLYFASAHWITGLRYSDADGSPWYRALDPSNGAAYYIQPEFVRLLTPDELAPLSPRVPPEQKRIQVHLRSQVLRAYEYGELVFSARVSTGQANYETPTGLFRTFHKRPTYHMYGGADASLVFDLPGVPWDTYITDSGVAMHGTYWHNDFGTPHSHGCINMRPQDARWIYCWTTPEVPPGEYLELAPGTGTQVLVADH